MQAPSVRKSCNTIRTKEEGHMKTEAETGWTDMPGATKKLEEAGRIFP